MPRISDAGRPTAFAYLTQLRIVRAKQLLAAGVKPRDIALQVGFYDQSQLNRHFRRIVGATPGEYARAVHGPPPARLGRVRRIPHPSGL